MFDRLCSFALANVTTLGNYTKVFAGDLGRLLLQVAYFLLLANTLSLHEMGVFAAVLACGVILGSVAGLGYIQLAFRTAAGRRRLAGHYLAGAYTALALSLPFGIAISLPIYFLIFADRLPLHSFVEILLAELLLWRLIETIVLINEGLGRFIEASAAQVLGMACRFLAIVLFSVNGGGTVEDWAHYYVTANVLGAVLAVGLFRPPLALKLNIRLLLARFVDAALLGFSNLMFYVQNEIDKLLVLVLVDAKSAGVFAISMRVIDLIVLPLRTFLVLYSRKLIRDRRSVSLVRDNLLLEALMLVVACFGFAIFLGILSYFPQLLGSNVALAKSLYGAMFFVPAFKALAEFHSVLYFSYDHMLARTVMSTVLSVMKTILLVLTIVLVGASSEWGFWLNFVFGAVYLVSLMIVYPVVSGWTMPLQLIWSRPSR